MQSYFHMVMQIIQMSVYHTAISLHMYMYQAEYTLEENILSFFLSVVWQLLYMKKHRSFNKSMFLSRGISINFHLKIFNFWWKYLTIRKLFSWRKPVSSVSCIYMPLNNQSLSVLVLVCVNKMSPNPSSLNKKTDYKIKMFPLLWFPFSQFHLDFL
jgi:hypothetical protein